MISYFIGVIPNKLEWLGVAAALTGCALMIFDPEAVRNNSKAETSIWPGMVDLGSAFFGALYFLMSARNVKSVPICFLIFLMNLHTFLINSVVAKLDDPKI